MWVDFWTEFILLITTILFGLFIQSVLISYTFKFIDIYFVIISSYKKTRPANQVHHFTPSSTHIPSAAPFLHENLVFGIFSDPWCGVPCHIISMCSNEVGEETLHQKLVLCSKFSFVFFVLKIIFCLKI